MNLRNLAENYRFSSACLYEVKHSIDEMAEELASEVIDGQFQDVESDELENDVLFQDLCELKARLAEMSEALRMGNNLRKSRGVSTSDR